MSAELISSWAPKTYDVVILGASGFTGKYVVREALKFLNTKNSPLKSLALAGRSPSRLSEALKWAADSPPKVPLITADTSDPESLSRLAAQARVILNCVGPFRLYGAPVVEACVEAGCDYLDICGEPEFMERMEAMYQEKALEKGSLVVSACGFDSVPADFGVLHHTKQWAGPSVPNNVTAYLSLESEKTVSLNSATYESAILGVAEADKLVRLRISKPNRTRLTIPGPVPPKGSLTEYHKELGLWTIKLPSADSSVVRRTLIALKENPQGLAGVNETAEHVQKREHFWSSVKPTHFGVKIGSKSYLDLVRAIIFGKLVGRLIKAALGRWFLLTFPSLFSLGLFRKKEASDDDIKGESFKMWFIGHGYSNAKLASMENEKPDTEVITRVMGAEDGYRTTAIILIQCALIVLADRHNLPKGGVYTPGIVFGPTGLQQRLKQNGMSFDFISNKTTSSPQASND